MLDKVPSTWKEWVEKRLRQVDAAIVKTRGYGTTDWARLLALIEELQKRVDILEVEPPVFCNQDAFRELIEATTKLTKWPPTFQGRGSKRWYCAMCMISVPKDAELTWLGDENNHEENCSWRLAKEALENLDDPGYSTKGE